MAKVSLARKKELNEPDEFITLSNRAAQFVAENRTRVITVVAVVVSAIVLTGVYVSYVSIRANNAAKESADLIATYTEAGKMSDSDFDTFANAHDAYLEKYGDTGPGKVAVVRFASASYANGKYAKALELYKKAYQGFENDPNYSGIMQSGMALSYEAMEKYPEAEKLFRQIESSPYDIKKAEACYHLAVIYKKMNKKSESDTYIDKLKTTYPDSMYLALVPEL